MADSLQPHGLYSPWNSPGHNTEMGSFSFSKGSSHQGKSPIKEQLSNIWASELKQIIFFFFCLLLLDKYSKKINKFEN